MKQPARRPISSARRRWVEHVEHHYRDPNGGYFYTADDAEALVARVKIADDSAFPPAMA